MNKIITLALFAGFYTGIRLQNPPPVFGQEYNNKVFHDLRVHSYLTPQRTVWKNDGGGSLLTKFEGTGSVYCSLGRQIDKSNV